MGTFPLTSDHICRASAGGRCSDNRFTHTVTPLMLRANAKRQRPTSLCYSYSSEASPTMKYHQIPLLFTFRHDLNRAEMRIIEAGHSCIFLHILTEACQEKCLMCTGVHGFQDVPRKCPYIHAYTHLYAFGLFVDLPFLQVLNFVVDLLSENF